MHVASAAECSPLPDLRFKSMGDVRRGSVAFREDSQNLEARVVLDSYRQFRLGCIRTSLSLLHRAKMPARVLMSARLKRLGSVRRKMGRSDRPMSAHEMDDIIGFRVVCESFDEAVALGHEIASKVPDTRTKNYIETVHPNSIGYRAIHGITRFRQPLFGGHVVVRFEVQIRTWYQHLWACWCESLGEQAKEGFTNTERTDQENVGALKRYLNDVSRKIVNWEEAYRGESQRTLLPFTDPYSLAVAWTGPQDRYGFRPCETDMLVAIRHLRYAESQRDLRPLLLVGVADSPNLKRVLTMTHPNFVGGRASLNPPDWMPEGA